MTKVILPESVKGKGWNPELPDYRDFPLSKLGLPQKPAEALPEKVSLRDRMSPVRDQGVIGSCTGFALSAAVEYLQRVDGDRYDTIYSPLFAYYHARVADGEEWAAVDCGAYLRDAAKIAASVGMAPESNWRYDPNKFHRLPNNTAHKAAQRWKSGPYYKCNSLADILTAISNKFPVIGGFSCFSNLFVRSVRDTGLVPMPAGAQEGGHAVCFMGFDRTRRLLEFKNSWGDWGDRGYGWLPFEFVERRFADDFWCITRESDATFHGKRIIT